MEAYIPALFHTLFLIWTNCRSYQRPARIVVLLQEFCNLFIKQVRVLECHRRQKKRALAASQSVPVTLSRQLLATNWQILKPFTLQGSAYLSADLLLREDPEESLQMVKRVIKVCSCFKESYQTQKERLADQVKHAPWDFPSAMIFSRFSQFFSRMLQLEVRAYSCIKV